MSGYGPAQFAWSRPRCILPPNRGEPSKLAPDRAKPRSAAPAAPASELHSERYGADEKADYVHRICGAFDHGIVPEKSTLELRSVWKEVFDRFPLRSSPAYHALRAFHGWNPLEKLPYLGDPAYVKLDRLEGREDGFEDWV